MIHNHEVISSILITATKKCQHAVSKQNADIFFFSFPAYTYDTYPRSMHVLV